MPKKTGPPTEAQDAVAKRLDAIIRILIESKNPKNSEGITESQAARLLHSSGLGPTEIAKILGMKSKTSVAPYLYGKD